MVLRTSQSMIVFLNWTASLRFLSFTLHVMTIVIEMSVLLRMAAANLPANQDQQAG